MEDKLNRTEIENDETTENRAPAAGSRRSRPGTKMDWITGLPFKSERGVELQPEETVKFYHDLH